MQHLHHITLEVPDIEACRSFYRDLGLRELQPGEFATLHGGHQLTLVAGSRRRLASLTIGTEDVDDIARTSGRLRAIGGIVESSESRLVSREPVTGVRVTLEVLPAAVEPDAGRSDVNRPGAFPRVNRRADAVLEAEAVRPTKLGHVVLGSTDYDATRRFFEEGIGFKISDEVRDHGAFLRCSTDHHNLLVQRAPVPFMHHTSWHVPDVDAIGRGAKAMLDTDPSRHVWGLGRHHVGSNFFWYLRDPAGNFAEYYADMDVIVDDELWSPDVFEGDAALYSWGPPPPPSFIKPEDLAELMV